MQTNLITLVPNEEKKIILNLKDNHYDFIKCIPAFFDKYYLCFRCLHGYSVYANHPCNEVCKKCKNKACNLA